MQDVKLYINDVLVDLPADVARQLRLSKGGTDAANIEARTADQSYSLTLPFTRVNHALFSDHADLQTTGKFFSVSPYRARLEANGKPILSGGWKLQAIKAGYQGLIYSDEVDVFALIGEKTLRQLTGFAPVAYKGQHNFTGFLGKSSRESDVCFPLVAYGNFFAPEVTEGVDVAPSALISAPIEVDDYTPSVYYTNILKKIFENIGWKAIGEPLDDPFFSELCLPHVGEEYRWNWQELLKLQAAGAGPYAFNLGNTIKPEKEGYHDHYWILPAEATYNPARRYRQDAGLPNHQTYSVRREGGYDAALSVQINSYHLSDSASSQVFLQLLRVPHGATLDKGEVLRSRQLAQSANVAPGTYSVDQFTPPTWPARVLLKTTYTYTGTSSEDQFTIYHYDVEYWEFNTATRQVEYRTTQESSTSFDVEGYSRPTTENFFYECVGEAKRLYTHNGSGGFATADEPGGCANTGMYLEPTDRLIPVLLLRTPLAIKGTVSMSVSNVSFSVTPSGEVGPATIDIAANLPELNQRDFVKSFMVLGNLRHKVDLQRKVITFYYRDRYELPADFAIDLTGLADPDACEFAPATTARRFLFQYADDTGDALLQANKGFADKVHDTKNALAEGDQALTLPFAATVFRTYQDAGRSVLLPCMASQDQLSAPLNTVQWAYGYVPRLLRYEGISAADDTLPMAFMGGRSRYGKSSFAGLGWQDLYARFYGDYITGIVKGHLLKSSFILPPDTYERLHPAKPVLFNGIIYRLNKVSGYQVAGRDTRAEVELLHIVKEAVGGGRPKASDELLGKEFSRQEFYPAEWY